MLQTLPQPPLPSRPAAEESQFLVYYIAWRIRKSHPWRSEEFSSRFRPTAAISACWSAAWKPIWRGGKGRNLKPRTIRP